MIKRLLLAVLLLMPLPALAQVCSSYPYTFVNGTTADATQVNANFASILTCANSLLAPLASPTFTGVPAAPTASPGTNTSQLATTAFVTAAINTLSTAGITIGSTTIALGSTQTALAGLTKLAGNGAVAAGVTADSFGYGFDASATYTAQVIYNMSKCTAYPCSPSPVYSNYDGLRGSAVALSGTTVTNVNGVAGYVFADVASAGTSKNAVALFGSASSAVNGAATWGVNTISTDNNAQASSAFTGNILQGYEADFNVTSTSTDIFGITVEGASIVQPAAANGFTAGCLALSGASCAPSTAVWTTAFLTTNGCCSNSLAAGALNSDGSGTSQPMIFFNNSSSNDIVVSAGAFNFGGTQNPGSGSTNIAIKADVTAGWTLVPVVIGSSGSCGGSFRCLQVQD